MKKTIKKVLRAIKLDVLLLGLLEKLVLALIKKIAPIQISAKLLLDELAVSDRVAEQTVPNSALTEF